MSQDPYNICPRPGCANLRDGSWSCGECWGEEEGYFRHAHGMGWNHDGGKFAQTVKGSYVAPMDYYPLAGKKECAECKDWGVCKLNGAFRCALHAAMQDKGMIALLWCLREGIEISPAREAAAAYIGVLKKTAMAVGMKNQLTDRGQAVLWELGL